MYPVLLIAMVSGAAAGSALAGELFALRPGQVHYLVDVNGDGDYFDFNESRLFADGLPVTAAAISSTAESVFVLDPTSRTIIRLRDENGDFDALDFGEILAFAELPAGPAGPTAIVSAGDDALFVADSCCGCVYAVRDLNHDGDALDALEVMIVANGLTSPQSIALRPDGAMLVAQQSLQVPVRILEDRNADGDFLDFAENISYAENFAAGTAICAESTARSLLLRPGDGTLQLLDDLTSDNDALDFAEVRLYAEGLSSASALAATPDGAFVARTGAAGGIWRVRDLNADGDALDFGEVLMVASSLTDIRGLALRSATVPCMKGDVDANGVVNIADISPMVNVLLGIVVPADPCPLDVNDDGLLDGRDVQAFVVELMGG